MNVIPASGKRVQTRVLEGQLLGWPLHSLAWLPPGHPAYTYTHLMQVSFPHAARNQMYMGECAHVSRSQRKVVVFFLFCDLVLLRDLLAFFVFLTNFWLSPSHLTIRRNEMNYIHKRIAVVWEISSMPLTTTGWQWGKWWWRNHLINFSMGVFSAVAVKTGNLKGKSRWCR